MNYDLCMEKIIKNVDDNNKLLLHVCCAPCSSAVLERLGDIFKITILYYNPNITDSSEYDKRFKEINKFTSSFKTKYPIDVVLGKYDPTCFFEISKGLENEPERGKRCYKCYKLRLEETARVAKEMQMDFFTTTLSLSPYKNAIWINELGGEIENEFNVNFLYSDFKKKNGYKRSVELSREFGLYRQDYCGCIFSLRDKKLSQKDEQI